MLQYHVARQLAGVAGWLHLQNLCDGIVKVLKAFSRLQAVCRCLELTDHKPEYAILGWVTGWLNVLGQFATTALAADILA